jgi:plastocyanin
MDRRALSRGLTVGIVVVVIVVAAGGYYILSSGGSNPSGPVSCTSSPTTQADVVVTIKDFSFNPATINITAGQSVEWVYPSGSYHHTVTSDSGAFVSGDIHPGDHFQCTFNSAGTYPYHCTVHPTTMIGKVNVVA